MSHRCVDHVKIVTRDNVISNQSNINASTDEGYVGSDEWHIRIQVAIGATDMHTWCIADTGANNNSTNINRGEIEGTK
jgi:hypothetical protein